MPQLLWRNGDFLFVVEECCVLTKRWFIDRVVLLALCFRQAHEGTLNAEAVPAVSTRGHIVMTINFCHAALGVHSTRRARSAERWADTSETLKGSSLLLRCYQWTVLKTLMVCFIRSLKTTEQVIAVVAVHWKNVFAVAYMVLAV